MWVMDVYLMDLPATVFTPRLAPVNISLVPITFNSLRKKSHSLCCVAPQFFVFCLMGFIYLFFLIVPGLQDKPIIIFL